MSQRLHIIAACADRKRLPALPELCLRSHRATGKRTRLRSFLDALEAASGERLPARDLYVGSYWAAIRELPDLAAQRGLACRLWVASAGYGLVPSDAPLHGYSATFQLGADDSVASSNGLPVRTQLASWWTALTMWPGPASKHPRRLVDLAKSDRRASFIVVASRRYVQAMGPDLVQAASIIGERFAVVSSSDSAQEPDLAEHLVPSEAALLPAVGGALPSLHARVARDIVLRSRGRGLCASSLRAHYQRLVERSTYEGMPRRDGASDLEVATFIRTQLGEQPDLHCTPALRMWRASGRACEQKRFKALFHEVAYGNAH